MLSQEQENYLAILADKGIKELADAEARQRDIEIQAKIVEAKKIKEDELNAQAKTLVEDGLRDFELNELPAILEN